MGSGAPVRGRDAACWSSVRVRARVRQGAGAEHDAGLAGSGKRARR